MEASAAGLGCWCSTDRIGWFCSWDIGPTWQIETDPARVSEVEVRFLAEGDTATRVEIEHRHLDRHGPGWEALRYGIADEQGWRLDLNRVAALAGVGSR